MNPMRRESVTAFAATGFMRKTNPYGRLKIS